ncbi:MAG TPA: VLRF1 family aeRF1-type release factor [Deinococcales bacterium]|nr:VLRF1 family aeRF1-type release factor [Deinococcales bacterium]
MQRFTTLTKESLTQVQNTLPRAEVLTLIVNTNPGRQENESNAHLTRTRNALRACAAPQGLADPVMEDLKAGDDVGGKSRLYYAAGGLEPMVFHVDVDLIEVCHYGAPDFEPLFRLLDTNKPTAVAVIDHERGRLFIRRVGEFSEIRRLENTIEVAPGGPRFREVPLNSGRDARIAHDVDNAVYDDSSKRNDARGDYDLWAPRAANQEGQFYKEIAEQLEKWRLEGRFERLLVAGPVKAVTHFKDQLPKPLAAVLAGEFSVEASAPVAQVYSAATPCLQKADQEADRKRLDQARETGVRGPEDTLAAVQEGRVFEVFVANDARYLPVWRDTDPDTAQVFAIFPENGQAPVSGQPVEALTLRDVLPDLREKYGLKVNYLTGENADTLIGEFGGLAGLTRY